MCQKNPNRNDVKAELDEERNSRLLFRRSAFESLER
jgi:hypothetical protein